jgi:hypothetical protein
MKIQALLLVMLLLGLIVPSVPAVNITFSDLDLITVQDCWIYGTNGTLLTMTNTSATNVPITASDIIIVLKPTSVKRLEDPNLLLQDAFNWCQTHAVEAVFACILIGLVFYGWRRNG